MTDLISKDKVLDILKNLGGCDAQDEYSKGWDDAINAVYKDVRSFLSIEVFTKEELHMLAFGLAWIIASKKLGNVDFYSILDKINKMIEMQNEDGGN